MRLYHLAYLKNSLKSNAGDELQFALWARVHTLPRVFVELWQGAELRRLASLAYEHSPIYRDLWRACDLHPRGIRSVGDIGKLPITAKKLFKKRLPDELLGDFAAHPERVQWRETSGSTGEPFRFPVSAREGLPSRKKSFHEYRFLLWRGNPLYYITDHLKTARIDEELFPHEFSMTRGELRRDPANACRTLRNVGTDVIRGTPTSLFELAEYAAYLPQEDRPRPRFLVSASETLTPSVRGVITDTLKGEVYNSYGLEEVGGIGVECRMHDGFHVHEESVLVEVVDEHGRPLPPGTIGRVLVTRLNRNMTVLPFIRYDTGDRGMILAAPCPCGLRARRLSLSGRAGGFLAIGTKRVHNFEFELALNFFAANIIRYQLAKVGLTRLELRIIPRGDFSSAVARRVRERFREKFGIVPRIAIVRALPTKPAGKTPTVIDETNHETTA